MYVSDQKFPFVRNLSHIGTHPIWFKFFLTDIINSDPFSGLNFEFEETIKITLFFFFENAFQKINPKCVNKKPLMY